VILALSLSVLLAATVYLCCRARRYFSDEGSFCTIAQGILVGKLPYQSFFNEKPPLQYFWTAAVMVLGGPTFGAARLAASMALAGTAFCVLYAPARRRNMLEVLTWIGLLFLASMDLSAFQDTAESSLAALFSASALLLNAGKTGKRASLIACLQGLIFGIAAGFRQTALAPALAILFLPQVLPWWRFYISSFSLGVLAWLGPLLALGLGHSLFESVVTFHLNNPLVGTYFRGPSWSDRYGFALWLLSFAWLASLKDERRYKIVLLLWIATMAASALGRMDAFRLWPSMAAMLVLIAEKTPDTSPAPRVWSIATTVVGLFVLITTYPRTSLEIINISRTVATMTHPDDRIWVGPYDPLPYCLARRQPASRYYFVLPWTAKPEVRRQVVDDIAAASPKLIVIEDRGVLGLRRLLPELRNTIAKSYHPSRSYEGLEFYARN
jgi:hypothetical protein